MKKLLLYTTATLMMLTSACKKFLEKEPDGRAEIKTPEQVSQLLGTAYPQANYMAFCESASDNVADKGAGELENTNVDPFHFEDVREDQQDSPEYYWYACYHAIAVANQALEVCENAANPQAYASQKGEALLARAYAHFMLVTLFAEIYDPATAASKPGIPYVTTPETVVIRQYDRKTVAYVYEMIEKDITAGIPLLDDNRYSIPQYHFTRRAANAFAARFYLYKRDYAKSISFANQVFANTVIAGMLRPWNTEYGDITYIELFKRYARITEPANLLLVETPSWWARQYYLVRYGLNSVKRDEILGRNVTGSNWSFRNHLYTVGTDNYVIPKIDEHFVRNSVNAQIGTGYVVVPLLTAEEVLLNRAEAYAQQNNTAAALKDLNTYVSTRVNDYDPVFNEVTLQSIRTFYSITDPREGLLRTVLDFRRAEYVQEGMRWFDILRFRIPVTHRTTSGETFTLTANDPRRLFQIPQSASVSGVEQNPR